MKLRSCTWSGGWRPCSWHRGWNQVIFKVPSNPNHSVSLSQTSEPLEGRCGEQSVSVQRAGRGSQILTSPRPSTDFMGGQNPGPAKLTQPQAPPGARLRSVPSLHRHQQSGSRRADKAREPPDSAQRPADRRRCPKVKSCLCRWKSADGSDVREPNLAFSTPSLAWPAHSEPAADSDLLKPVYRYLSCLYFEVHGH